MTKIWLHRSGTAARPQIPRPRPAPASSRPAGRVELLPRRSRRRLENDTGWLLLGEVLRRFGGDLGDRRFAIWGATHPPAGGDRDRLPAIAMIDALTASGAQVAVHDPAAAAAERSTFRDVAVVYATDPYDACEGADALLVVTRRPSYSRVDWERLTSRMRGRLVIDSAQVFDADEVRRHGFEYHRVGGSELRGTN